MFASLAALHHPPLPLFCKGRVAAKGVAKWEQVSLSVQGFPHPGSTEQPVPVLVAVVRWLCRTSQEEAARDVSYLWLLLLH